MPAAVTADAAPVDARNADIARLLNEANRRTASGESADVVEQWLTQAMQADGMATTPPIWDVYGQKRWQVAQNVNETAAAPAFVVSRDGGPGDRPSLASTPAVVTTKP